MNELINSYRDLKVWQAGMALAEESYRISRRLPREELFGLCTQIRRASSSVPANIAEGHGRESTGSFVQHLRIAQGSLKELETHLLLCVKVELVSAVETEKAMLLADEIGRMIRALIRSLQDKAAQA